MIDGRFVAATVDGQIWRASGQGSFFTSTNGSTTMTILGYTPLPGSTLQADRSKPMLEIVFSEVLPTAGTYDVATTTFMTVMYMPDQNRIFGGQTGVVVIPHITTSTVDGTFAFTGLLAPNGPETVSVTDGSFSVPLGTVP
jgi:hypothetical protein